MYLLNYLLELKKTIIIDDLLSKFTLQLSHAIAHVLCTTYLICIVF